MDEKNEPNPWVTLLNVLVRLPTDDEAPDYLSRGTRVALAGLSAGLARDLARVVEHHGTLRAQTVLGSARQTLAAGLPAWNLLARASRARLASLFQSPDFMHSFLSLTDTPRGIPSDVIERSLAAVPKHAAASSPAVTEGGPAGALIGSPTPASSPVTSSSPTPASSPVTSSSPTPSSRSGATSTSPTPQAKNAKTVNSKKPSPRKGDRTGKKR